MPHYTRTCMQKCVDLLLSSVSDSRQEIRKGKQSEADWALSYRTLNSNVITVLCLRNARNTPQDSTRTQNEEKALMDLISDNLRGMLGRFVWTARCCDDATEVADTFNGMHLAGIVVCKSFAVLCGNFFQMHSVSETGLQSIVLGVLFPQYSAIHVSSKEIANMSYSELVFVLTSLQQKWNDLIHLDIRAAATALAACMARFGVLASLHLSESVLDDLQEREKILDAVGALTQVETSEGMKVSGAAMPAISDHIVLRGMWILSKRAIRHFVTTFLCMNREISLWHSSDNLVVQHIQPAEFQRFVSREVLAYGHTISADTCDPIRACFERIKGVRESFDVRIVSALVVTDLSMPDKDRMWDFLAKKIGPHKMGPRPRKMNAEFNSLLADVIVALSDTYNHPESTLVTRSCLNIIQTALKFYYVVPSAERFREIVLMQNLCPGQRLNYAFDYMHFDTGMSIISPRHVLFDIDT